MTEEGAQDQQPVHLVIVGAAAGIGRWIADHVFVAHPWTSVTLVDRSDAVRQLPTAFTVNADGIARIVLGGNPPAITLPVPATAGGPSTVVVVAVPLATLEEVASWLGPQLAPGTLVIDLSHDRSRADAALGNRFPHLETIGVHALFGTTADSADGQIFAVCTEKPASAGAQWIVQLLESVGGTVNTLTPEHHDTVMRYVQTASHRALLTFADVIGSSRLDLASDLWANRTPVFELLLALASRVLAPGQESTTASIQLIEEASDVSAAFARARDALDVAVEKSDELHSAALTDHLQAIRSPFTGSLFTTMQQAGVLATGAVQSTRARVASQRRSNDLVGVRSLDGERLHVGRVVKMSPTSFTLTDLLVGRPGQAALLVDDAAVANAKKLGISGKARNVDFTLGKVRLLSSDELEAELDHWLVTVPRGCKFLVPDSIAGASAVRVVEGVPHVESAELVSEEVRLGQRECVVRFRARVDRNLNDVERSIQNRIDEVFDWPDGVMLPLARGPLRTVGFLGPAGTFSDLAARRLVRVLGASGVDRREYPDFPSLVHAAATGEVQVSIVPITNSSSGLVDLAAAVLSEDADGRARVIAGGMIDVPVRFDAYTPVGRELGHGDQVFSHPQGFRQCSQFIAAHRLVEVVCTSTAEACARVRETGSGVALAAAGLASEFSLSMARANVGNLSGALTRFVALAPVGSFGAPPHADATLRSLWIVPPSSNVLSDSAHGGFAAGGSAYFDEVLRGPSGATLVISTSRERLPDDATARYLGTIPWSPRTPIVVV